MDNVDGREEFSKAGMFGTTSFVVLLGIVLWIVFFLRPVVALVQARRWAQKPPTRGAGDLLRRSSRSARGRDR